MPKLSVKHPIPECSTEGCSRNCVPSQHYYTVNRKGERIRTHTQYRNICNSCHNKKTARRYGMARISQMSAKRKGLTEADYRATSHPYLRYRKDYCENKDARLGFTCNTVLPTAEMLEAAGVDSLRSHSFLEVDHINGDPKDNRPENLQTLCKHCHVIKGIQNKDHTTKGRKTYKKEKEESQFDKFFKAA